MKLTKIAAAILAGSVCLVAAPTFAAGDFDGSETSTFGVGLTVEQECQIATGAISFGNTGIIDTDLTGTSNIAIECTDTSPFRIALSAGSSTDEDDRTMNAGGAAVVHYGLYRDSGYTQNWGFTQGTDTFDDTAGATSRNIPVYAKVPQHQNVPSGTYADSITATIWYDEGLTP